MANAQRWVLRIAKTPLELLPITGGADMRCRYVCGSRVTTSGALPEGPRRRDDRTSSSTNAKRCHESLSGSWRVKQASAAIGAFGNEVKMVSIVEVMLSLHKLTRSRALVFNRDLAASLSQISSPQT